MHLLTVHRNVAQPAVVNPRKVAKSLTSYRQFGKNFLCLPTGPSIINDLKTPLHDSIAIDDDVAKHLPFVTTQIGGRLDE